MVCAIFYTHQTGGMCGGICVCDRTHQMEKTESLSSGETDKMNILKVKKYYLLIEEK